MDTSISVVDQTDILAQNSFTLIDSLKYIPGAWTETRGRKVKQFFTIRGQRYPYPEYSLNGAWQREFHELPYFLNAANFERIEVLRSGSALLTGPGGIVGMINLVPRTYTKPETTIYAQYGTFHTSTLLFIMRAPERHIILPTSSPCTPISRSGISNLNQVRLIPTFKNLTVKHAIRRT